MLTNRPDKNRCATCSFGAFLAVAVLLAVGVHSAEASLLVYEPFDYNSGEDIANQGGGTGFNQAWDNFTGAANGSVRSGSLPSSSVPTLGHSGSFDTSLMRRSIDEISGTAGTQTWASFLFSASVSVADPFYAASLALSPIEGLEGSVWIGAFANPGGELYLGLGSFHETPYQLSSIAVVPGETYLLTVSIDWNAGDTPETIRLYLNPASGAAPNPGDAIATASINIASPWDVNTPNRISYIAAGGLLPGGDVAFDEIRIGNTFADVVSVPEPSTACLFVIALGAFARFRVRRA